MSTLRTAGELRGFLADVLVGVRDGSIDANKANAIAKVAAQINQSLSTEVTTALQMEKMGAGRPAAGSMLIGAPSDDETPMASLPPVEEESETPEVEMQAAPAARPVKLVEPPKRDGDKIWCEQCEMRVTTRQAVGCKSPHCKAKEAA